MYICFMILLMILCVLMYQNGTLKKKIRTLTEGEEWQKLAYTDALTGLGNRMAYSRHIAELEKAGAEPSFGIMLFDVDNFKAINDTNGHLAGDRVLQEVARMLLLVFSDAKYHVYRIGGDEFAVIAERAAEAHMIQLLLELKQAEEKSGVVRLSKGYAISGGSVKKAFEEADKMLYADKASKKEAAAIS